MCVCAYMNLYVHIIYVFIYIWRWVCECMFTHVYPILYITYWLCLFYGFWYLNSGLWFDITGIYLNCFEHPFWHPGTLKISPDKQGPIWTYSATRQLQASYAKSCRMRSVLIRHLYGTSALNDHNDLHSY